MFEIADNGTLFLDEIGELDIALQAKILRALQEREIRRVGGIREIAVDVRVVAATNRDLLQMIEEKRFREDLYYRLNVLSIEIPPLRERRPDIPVLIDYFVKKHTRGTDRKITIEAEPRRSCCTIIFIPAMSASSNRPSNGRSCCARTTRSPLEDLPPEMTQGTAPASSATAITVQTAGRRRKLRRRRTQPDNAGDGPHRQQHHKVARNCSG